MKKHSRILGLCSFLLLSCFCISAFAAPSVTAAKPVATRMISAQNNHAADVPVIQEFNVPTKVVQGDQLSFKWTVVPSPGGSQITRVTISGNNITMTRQGQPASQSSGMPANTAGYHTLVLTATNAANKTATTSRTVQVLTLNEVMNNLKIANLQASPKIFMQNQPIDFMLTVQNSNPMALTKANIFILHGSRVVASMTDRHLVMGSCAFPLHDSGFQATSGNYTVDLEYKGRHLNKTFKIVPITSYTIESLK